MKRFTLAMLACLPFGALAADAIGVPARGGQPEYLFIEKVERAEAPATAQMIARALAVGRLVIFAQMKKLTDPELGDKGFTGDVFLDQWKTALEAEFLDASPAQQRIIDKLLWAGKQSIDNNQDRLNVKGVKWKHFLPAKWARETGQLLNSRTGIVTKQPSVNYRAPSNAPDAREVEVLTAFVGSGGETKATGEFATMGKQPVYRYYDPVTLMPPCLACHGKPKGEPDMLGFEKDGFDEGDVIGMISVTVAVTE